MIVKTENDFYKISRFRILSPKKTVNTRKILHGKIISKGYLATFFKPEYKMMACIIVRIIKSIFIQHNKCDYIFAKILIKGNGRIGVFGVA